MYTSIYPYIYVEGGVFPKATKIDGQQEQRLRKEYRREDQYLSIEIHTDNGSYMLNTWSEEKNTAFYSYIACFMNTVTLNMCVFLSNTGSPWRNT